jgi:L-threonylcarbamoyladenylate synthase
VFDRGIAVRWPADPFLNDLVAAVGIPLISTSANLSGGAPIAGPAEIPESWGSQLDAAVDGGGRSGQPSTLVRVERSGGMTVLREGAVRIDPRP